MSDQYGLCDGQQPLRLLVCGPRDCTIKCEVWDAITKASGILQGDGPEVLIHGGAPGVDETAGRWAVSWRVPILAFLADWKKYGRGAGPRRNQQMLDDGKPNFVLAFQHKNRKTPGTQDMIRRARKAGVRVEVVEV